MTKMAFLFTLFAAVLIGLLPAAPAQAAGAPRTFISAAGSDANSCTNVATPCRHLAAAFAATAADGEIYVLDPANYGSLTITHGVSIEGHGWASIAPVVNGNAITITANAGDKINIIGVVLDGTAVTNTNGIQFVGGGNLTVRDSVIRNFTKDGITFQANAASQLSVSNTLVSDNGSTGIAIDVSGTAAVAAVLDHVTVQNNTVDGIHAQSTTAQTVNVAVSDSVIANNATNGISTFAGTGATVNAMVRNSTIFNNAASGLNANGANSTIRVTRSTIAANLSGWFITATGVVTSYGDNNIDGNTNANTEPPGPLTYH